MTWLVQPIPCLAFALTEKLHNVWGEGPRSCVQIPAN